MSSGSQDLTNLFDLSPEGFPFSQAANDAIKARRQALPSGTLFIDDVLSSLGIAPTLYPPSSPADLHALLTALDEKDKLVRDAVVYYLLIPPNQDRREENGREREWAAERFLPEEWVGAAEALWGLDHGDYEHAVIHLSHPLFPSALAPAPLKVLQTLSSDSKHLLAYVRLAKPDLSTPEELELEVAALAEHSVREAWAFVKDFEGAEDVRERLIRRVFDYCLLPRPRPEALQSLLPLPLSAREASILRTYSLPPHPPASAAAAHDLLLVRAIQTGRLVDAVKLSRAPAHASPSGLGQVRRAALVNECWACMPEVQRRLVEADVEVGAEEKGAGKTKAKWEKEKQMEKEPQTEDVEMSWTSISNAPSAPPAWSAPSPAPQATAAPAGPAPLSASTSFRQQAEQGSVLKALVSSTPTAGTESPFSGPPRLPPTTSTFASLFRQQQQPQPQQPPSERAVSIFDAMSAAGDAAAAARQNSPTPFSARAPPLPSASPFAPGPALPVAASPSPAPRASPFAAPSASAQAQRVLSATPSKRPAASGPSRLEREKREEQERQRKAEKEERRRREREEAEADVQPDADADAMQGLEGEAVTPKPKKVVVPGAFPGMEPVPPASDEMDVEPKEEPKPTLARKKSSHTSTASGGRSSTRKTRQSAAHEEQAHEEEADEPADLPGAFEGGRSARRSNRKSIGGAAAAPTPSRRSSRLSLAPPVEEEPAEEEVGMKRSTRAKGKGKEKEGPKAGARSLRRSTRRGGDE